MTTWSNISGTLKQAAINYHLYLLQCFIFFLHTSCEIWNNTSLFIHRINNIFDKLLDVFVLCSTFLLPSSSCQSEVIHSLQLKVKCLSSTKNNSLWLILSLTRVCFLELAPFRTAVQIRLGWIFISVLQSVPHFVDSSSPFEKELGVCSSIAKINHNRWILSTESRNCKAWGCLFKRCQNLRGRALTPVSNVTVLQLFSTFSFLLSCFSYSYVILWNSSSVITM